MLDLIKAGLKQLLNDMDSGNSKINEEELKELLQIVLRLISPELSKTLAADYIGVSRATFDNYIKKGIIPEGEEKLGFSNKIWYKSELANIKLK